MGVGREPETVAFDSPALLGVSEKSDLVTAVARLRRDAESGWHVAAAIPGDEQNACHGVPPDDRGRAR